jgi:signal transduction histidine kinase
VSTLGQAPPARPRPPLTKRLRPGHWVALDTAAAAVLTFVLTLSIHTAVVRGSVVGLPAGPYPVRLASYPTGPLVAFVLAGAMCLPVALRRRRPLLAFGWAAAAATLVTLLVPTVSAPYFYLPAAYVLYLVAVVSRRKVALAALGTLLVLIVTEALRMDPVGRVPGLVVPPVLIAIIAWTFGYAAGQRRVYAAHLQDQAAASAVTEERLRIARELHDVVAHSMTVIAVQAGYGRHVIDAQPDKAGEALGAIQATSREALTDMRRMLGVLRRPGSEPFGKRNEPGDRGGDRPAGLAVPAGQGGLAAGARGGNGGTANRAANGAGEAAPLAPAPGLADLDRLAARIGHAGVLVDLRVRGSRRELPPGIDLSAFRIVQEALTNVVKHADTPSCRVTVSYGEDELFVEITDEGRGGHVPAVAGSHGPGAGGGGGAGVVAGGGELAGGHGLIGMRERVSLYGGELSAAPLPERGFRVAARLPIGDGGS